MKTHRRIILIASIVVIVLGGLFIFYEMFLDGTVINPVVKHNMPTIESNEIPPTGNFSAIASTIIGSYQLSTDQTSYHPGDTIYAIYNLCIYRRVNPIVQWTFVNDIAQSLTARQGNILIPGCYTDLKVPIATVPDEFSVAFRGSEYRLYGDATFQPNPFRTITYTFITNQFTVN